MKKLVRSVILGVSVITLSFGHSWGEQEKKLLAGDLPDFDGKSIDGKPSPIMKPGPKGIEQVGELKGNAIQGEVIYKKYCVYCHGKTGFGDGLAAMTLKPSPANFIERETFKKDDQILFEIVTYGLRRGYQLEMPAWGPVLSKQERLDVLSFVKKLSEKGSQ
ncbi:MAG: c-type cytochrome [Nitrospinota bacterium]